MDPRALAVRDFVGHVRDAVVTRVCNRRCGIRLVKFARLGSDVHIGELHVLCSRFRVSKAHAPR
jgi:hypothetical protein